MRSFTNPVNTTRHGQPNSLPFHRRSDARLGHPVRDPTVVRRLRVRRPFQCAPRAPRPRVHKISTWINSAPLTLAALRGKVVLVDFWTFGCINCQRTLPYLKEWYAKFHSHGFEIVGVHTPELSFERSTPNVRKAVARLGITYPVAIDPAFATWNAYENQYWPAEYFIDKKGRIRHYVAGEGGYQNSPKVIEALLDEPT